MLNRGNKLKDLLKTKNLAVFGAKNKPKTNSILSAKSANQGEKNRSQGGVRCQVAGFKARQYGTWNREEGQGTESVFGAARRVR
jgi:hypothetical protein